MAGPSNNNWISWGLATAIVAVVMSIVPPFHVHRIERSAKRSGHFAAAEIANQFWHNILLPSSTRAVDAKELIAAMKADPSAAKRFGRQPAVNGPYLFFVKGRGTVTGHDDSGVWIEVSGDHQFRVRLVAAPIFGTVVRDATGLLKVGDFNSREFNALDLAINKLAESEVQPQLQRLAKEGSSLNFVGCATISAGADNASVLNIIPISLDTAT